MESRYNSKVTYLAMQRLIEHAYEEGRQEELAYLSAAMDRMTSEIITQESRCETEAM